MLTSIYLANAFCFLTAFWNTRTFLAYLAIHKLHHRPSKIINISYFNFDMLAEVTFTKRCCELFKFALTSFLTYFREVTQK